MTIKNTNISVSQIIQGVILSGILGVFSILWGIHNWQIRAEERELSRAVKINDISNDMKEIKAEVRVMKETDLQNVKDRLRDVELNPRK